MDTITSWYNWSYLQLRKPTTVWKTPRIFRCISAIGRQTGRADLRSVAMDTITSWYNWSYLQLRKPTTVWKTPRIFGCISAIGRQTGRADLHLSEKRNNSLPLIFVKICQYEVYFRARLDDSSVSARCRVCSPWTKSP
ncbi:hypothetical protein J6590_087574 [Homalodisca vitripennis]|nr:hypothetical protein J6590_087574 [Homalodisca vitripennis]